MNHGSDNNNNNSNWAIQPLGGPNGARPKGVVPQPNGHWGAQIYANHQRIWLGTFLTERDAAMAYDSASMKLRSNDAYRNLPADAPTLALESDFQSHFSEEAILAMIKDGSYPTKLAEFYRAWQAHPNHPDPRHGPLVGSDSYEYRGHFEKELTPSDVGKLNRLVIPKKYAVKFFPNVEELANGNGEGPDPELEFRDMSTASTWRFRYCYWKSSQSFVFTKGWNKFVKDKGLKTKDVVIFYACRTRPKAGEEGVDFSMIDIRYCEGGVGGGDGAGPSGAGEGEGRDEEEEEEVNVGQEENVEVEGERRRIKLFGVDIM